MQVFVTGSSARLLSREVATSLRGRGMDVLVHPFSFREALRHTGDDPPPPETIDHRLRRYLIEGGFPEAQGVEPQDRAALLTGYVDVVVLRDVIDRHGVTNPLALRWMQRQLLANPGGRFSVRKQYTRYAQRACESARTPCTPTSATWRTRSWCAPSPCTRPPSGGAWFTRARPIQWIRGADRAVRDQRPQPCRPCPRDRSPAGTGAARLGGVLRTHDRRVGSRLLRASRGGAAPAGAGVPGNG